MKYSVAVLFLLLACLVAYSMLLRPKSGRALIRVGTPTDRRVEKSEAEWQAVLSDDAFRVTRRQGTERAFSGAFWNAKGDGVYQCVCCGQALFDSDSKFDSGT